MCVCVCACSDLVGVGCDKGFSSNRLSVCLYCSALLIVSNNLHMYVVGTYPQGAGNNQDRFDGTQTPIVMVLFG